MCKELWIQTNKYEIPAVLEIPKGKACAPCMILCHGTASHKNEVGDLFLKLSKELSKNGIASIRFDFAGCGDSRVDEQELTFFGEVEDTLAIYEYVHHLSQIDSEKIGILGFSQGARVMAEVLKKLPNLSCAVSWSGACHNGYGIYEKLFGAYEEEAKKNGYARIPMGWRSDLHLSKRWFEEIKASEPMKGFKNYEGPMLVLAGKEDAVVEYQHSEEIYKYSKHKDSKLIVYEQADHTLGALDETSTIKDLVIEETVNWIRKEISLE